jgi:hypothetical protein
MLDVQNAKSIRIAAGLAALSLLAVIPGAARGQNAPSNANSSSAASQSQATSPSNAPAPEDSLAAAARKAKEQNKEQKGQNTKPAKVFTNDNLPSTGISTVGSSSAAASSDSAPSTSSAPGGQGEKYWRDKFASLNKKLDQDQTELDVMQRELGQLNMQNYSDPVQAMQQGYSRSDIQKKTDDISAKQKAVDEDKQAIDDAEDDLRKSGGDPGWAR